MGTAQSLKRLVPIRWGVGLRRTQARILNFGLRYKCPLCRARLKALLPFRLDIPVLSDKRVVGGGLRANAVCPVCSSSDRERFVYLYLLHETDAFHGTRRFLHVAPETALSRVLVTKKNLDYVTADAARSDVMVKLDVMAMPYPDASFDVIVCNHVLEHVADDRKAMEELYRVLIPAGWAILQVPLSLALAETYEDPYIATPAAREAAFGQHDHVRLYAKDYADRLAAVGFKVDVFEWTAARKQFGGRANAFALIEDERLYVARKPA